MRRLAGFLLAGLYLGAASTAHSQAWEEYDYENLEFRGVSAELGWVTPSRVNNTLLIGLRADLGYLGPNVRIVPGLSFWSSELRRGEIDRLAEQIRSVCLQQHPSLQCPPLDLGEIRMSDLAINIDGLFEFPNTPFLFIPFVGTGGSLHFLNSRGELINDTFIEDFLDSLAPGLNLFGGMRLPLAENLELIAGARYMLASEIRYGVLSAGMSWLFPARTTPAASRRSATADQAR
jgi:hypothetical protein